MSILSCQSPKCSLCPLIICKHTDQLLAMSSRPWKISQLHVVTFHIDNHVYEAYPDWKISHASGLVRMKTGACAVCVSHQYVRHAAMRLNSSVAIQNVEHKEERPNFNLSWGLPRWSLFLSICKTANPPIAIVLGGRLHLSSRRVCYPLRLLMSLLPTCIRDGCAGWSYIHCSMSAQTIFKV